MLSSSRRLSLDQPVLEDTEALHGIYADLAVWTHFPGGRHATAGQTLRMVGAWIALWERDGLGPWIAREASGRTILGSGGCAVSGDAYWNLSYRFAAGAHGHGYATELSLEAIRQARLIHPSLPVVAYLLEHNVASARVAEKAGLTLAYRGPDTSHPELEATRLVYADRALTPGDLGAIVH